MHKTIIYLFIFLTFQVAAQSFKFVSTQQNCELIKNFDGFWESNGTQNSIENLEQGKGYFIRLKN